MARFTICKQIYSGLLDTCYGSFKRWFLIYSYLSLVMRKPDFCICENKAADQLCGKRTTDQRLRFRYMDSAIPLLPKSEISSLLLSSVTAQPSLRWIWSGTPKTGFLRTRLISR